MKRAITAALMVVTALSLAGCDEAPQKTEAAQPTRVQVMRGKPYILIIVAEGAHKRKDYAKALTLFKSVARKREAQYNLGVMYANGQGVAQDYVRAHMWYNLGAISGYKDAISNRDYIEIFMTPAQIAEAQAMARKCQASNFEHCD
jgi:TPR repeat protein